MTTGDRTMNMTHYTPQELATAHARKERLTAAQRAVADAVANLERVKVEVSPSAGDVVISYDGQPYRWLGGLAWSGPLEAA
jgi:hypothetical protein